MTLAPGTQFGPYEIGAQIGAGGMGVVYRARDTKLQRDVAIKVLPELFANDPDRLARFRREAQVLASLNHTNIGHIYGLEESDGARALVLELVEGPTLADRIAQGPIALDEALPIAKQIAEALEAAHEQGIVHRDLKPANVKVRPDGTVKVLDFGLAKAMDPASIASADESVSPTITTPAMTQMGVILGTASYMSPEQARGKAVDKRSDIWAFGCVLFEMLAGRRTFEAEDVTLTLAEVVKSEPDWTALPPLPPAVALSLRRCFKKEPRQRLRDIGEMRLALEGALDTDLTLREASTPSATSTRRAWKWVVPSAAAVVSAIVATLVTVSLRPKPIPEVVRFQIHAPVGSKIPPGNPALSRDGRKLAYVVTDPDGKNRIHVQNIDEVESRALEGTEDAIHPFWSPDGKSLAFASDRVLKRIDISGGVARQLDVDVNAPWHGSWNQFGDLLYVTGAPFGTTRLSADGSKQTSIVTTKASETGANFPFFLGDGRRFLVRIADVEGKSAIYLASIDTPERKLVVDDVLSAPLLAPTPTGRSYLLYLKDEALLAHEFDEASGKVRGTARTLVDRIGRVASPPLMPTATAAANGTLAFQTGGDFTAEEFTWLSRAGQRLGTVPLEVAGQNPSLSPDGRWIAFQASTASDLDIWVTDTVRSVTSRLTRGGGNDRSPVWSPDGRRVAYLRSGKIYAKSIDDGAETTLADANGTPRAWSSDGKYLLYDSQARRLFLVPLAGGTAIPVGPSDGSSRDGRFSPDGKFIAYNSDRSGREEVYVDALPPLKGSLQVSGSGGVSPRWNRTKPELFFVAADRNLMVVDVQLGPTLSAGVPRKLFPLNTLLRLAVGYDVTGDGQRFLVNSLAKDVPNVPITVVLNWWAELEKPPN